MSVSVVLIPGVMGSELFLPQRPRNITSQIWWYRNKSAQEVVTALLEEPNLEVGDLVIDPVLGFEKGYREIIDLLTAECEADGRTFIKWPYDWRKDIHLTAELLRDQLRKIDSDELILVAHSMGGLVARLLIENSSPGDEVVSRIKKLFLVCVPNFGAPLALFRVLGFDGLPAGVMPGYEFKRLSSRPILYPSPYQILPAPGVKRFKDMTGARIDSLEVMKLFPDVFSQVGIEALRRTQNGLDVARKPSSLAYFLIGGVGENEETISSIEVISDEPGADSPLSRVFGSGDGTVPEWSALPIQFNQHEGVQSQAIPNVTHSGIFGDKDFKDYLSRNLFA